MLDNFEALDAEKFETEKDRLIDARNQFWRLTATSFAELFLPTNSETFYGKSFELVIDSIRFVCFPLKTSEIKRKQEVFSFSVVIALDASMDSIVEQSRTKLRIEPTPLAYGKEYPLSLAGIRPFRIIVKDFADLLSSRP